MLCSWSQPTASLGFGGSFRPVSGLRQRCSFRQGGICHCYCRGGHSGYIYMVSQNTPQTSASMVSESVKLLSTCWRAAASADGGFTRLGVGYDRSELLVCVLGPLSSTVTTKPGNRSFFLAYLSLDEIQSPFSRLRALGRTGCWCGRRNCTRLKDIFRFARLHDVSLFSVVAYAAVGLFEVIHETRRHVLPFSLV